MAAVTDTLLFLEFSEDFVLDDDAAVEVTEMIAATLSNLGPAERAAYIEYLRRRAKKPGEDEQFLLGLPEALGLAGA